MDRRRSSNGYGANAISHHEIAEFSRLYGVRFKPWELRALDAMEIARLAFLNKRDEVPAEEPSAQASVVQSAPMTPQLFDALFK